MDSKEDMDYLRVFVFKCTRTDELDFQRAIKNKQHVQRCCRIEEQRLRPFQA